MKKYLFKKINQRLLSLNQDVRKQHFSVFAVTGTPFLGLFLFLNMFFDRNYQQAIFITPIFVSLPISLVLLKHRKENLFLYRLNTVLFGSLLMYMASTGGPQGTKLLWMYIYPLTIFFILGRKEGVYWNLATLVSLFVIFIDPADLSFVYPYSSATVFRFLLSYFYVSLAAYWFEYYRESYRNRLIAQTEKLEKALAEVKTLSGYLPVCASCRKVREKDGEWVSLESYVESHSNAEISHSLCEDCARELYPSIIDEIKK